MSGAVLGHHRIQFTAIQTKAPFARPSGFAIPWTVVECTLPAQMPLPHALLYLISARRFCLASEVNGRAESEYQNESGCKRACIRPKDSRMQGSCYRAQGIKRNVSRRGLSASRSLPLLLWHCDVASPKGTLGGTRPSFGFGLVLFLLAGRTAAEYRIHTARHTEAGPDRARRAYVHIDGSIKRSKMPVVMEAGTAPGKHKCIASSSILRTGNAREVGHVWRVFQERCALVVYEYIGSSKRRLGAAASNPTWPRPPRTPPRRDTTQSGPRPQVLPPDLPTHPAFVFPGNGTNMKINY